MSNENDMIFDNIIELSSGKWSVEKTISINEEM
jgi:hypothetical protein